MNINVACCVTLVRILLTPVVVVCMLQNRWSAAFVIFLIAALTDILDGFIARRWNMQSKFGQLLDPVADKILLSTVLYTMLMFGQEAYPSMICYAVWFLLFKEFILLVGGAILWFRYKKFIAPSLLSRIVSLCEVVLIFVLFMFVLAQDVSIPLKFGFPVFLSFIPILYLNVILSAWLLIRYSIVIFNIRD